MLRGLPGKLTIRRRAADAGDAAREHPVRRVLAGGEPHRLGDARGLALDHGAGRLGGDVVGAMPVPPVVRTSSQPASSHQWRSRSAISSRSSGITSVAVDLAAQRLGELGQRRARLVLALAAAFEVEIVRIAARISRSGRRRRGPGAAAPAGLLDQLDALDRDAALEALDHVVDGQGGDRAGRHRLHLDAGARRRPAPRR